MPHYLVKILLLLCLFQLASCSLTRTVPKGEHLYNGAKVKIKKPKRSISTANLEANYNTLLKSTQHNRRWAGIRWKLRFYNFFHTKKQKGLFHRLQKKWGEPPILYDSTNTERIKEVMENQAFNEGFFDVSIEAKVKKRRKKAKVKYIITVEEPSLMATVNYNISNEKIKNIIENSAANSLLKVNTPYNLETLKAERERITNTLRQNGYYFFRSDLLKFRADTTKDSRKVFFDLVLQEDATPNQLQPQRIHKIFVYPNTQEKPTSSSQRDTITFEGIQIIGTREVLRPEVLRDAIALQTGEWYSLTSNRKTIERLSFLKNHQFIDVRFNAAKGSDSLLNVLVRLTPRKKLAVEGSVGLVWKSGIYFGPEVSLSYLNRNVWQGAEQLRYTISGNYNFPLVDGINTAIEQSVSAELVQPRLWVPSKTREWSRAFIAQTRSKFKWENERVRIPLTEVRGILEPQVFPEMLDRLNTDTSFAPLVAINNFNLSLSYQFRRKQYVQHEVVPLNLVFQLPNYELEEARTLLLLFGLFDQSNNGNGVQLNLEEMIIFKPSYAFLFHSRLKKLKKHNHRYQAKIALSGNRLLRKNDLIPNELLESQFIQLEQDIRYYLRWSKRQTIACRLAFNISIPFQDQVLLPFFDLYEVGGPNSVRAFLPRRVGPGSLVPSDETFFFTGKGDVLLESSLEWRPKLTDLVELGFFVDAGNTWLFQGGTNSSELAKFRVNNFYRQLAAGAGVGLRLDFDILLLRFDLAVPLAKPWLPKGERWVAQEIALLNRGWRSENLQLQVNFGYSF
ncbi:MAG: BamA/TamA family outer membrane protein [Bacteroidota bacterium]